LFGYDLGFMGGVTTSATFQDTFNHPSPSLLGFLVASYEIGALFGALIIFVLGDKFGRRNINISGVSVIATGGAIQASSFGVPQFLVGRIVSGIGLGMTTSVIPIWLAECTVPKSRGRMIAIQLSHLILGLILSNWTDYGSSAYSSSVQWRLPCALQICICILCLCILPWLPESPRWLAKVNRMVEARHNLAALRGFDTASTEVSREMHEIHFALTSEAEAATSWTALFKNAGIGAWSRVVIAMAANAGQQLTGSNIISSFGPYIFQTSIGMSRHEALLVSGGLQVWFFASSLIPWFIIDKVGRRKLFLFGSAGMALCMTLSAVFVGIGGQKLGYAATVCMYLFYTFFTTGWQANMWICEIDAQTSPVRASKLTSTQIHRNSFPSTCVNAAQLYLSLCNGSPRS
jgi:sugar porter (SP) family MFS transporter